MSSVGPDGTVATELQQVTNEHGGTFSMLRTRRRSGATKSYLHTPTFGSPSTWGTSNYRAFYPHMCKNNYTLTPSTHSLYSPYHILSFSHSLSVLPPAEYTAQLLCFWCHMYQVLRVFEVTVRLRSCREGERGKY